MGRLRTNRGALAPLVCFLLLCPSPVLLQEAIPPDESALTAVPVSGPGEITVEAVVDSPRVPSNQTLTLIVRATCVGDIHMYDFLWPAPPDLDRFDIVGSSSGNIVREDSRGRVVSSREFTYILQPVGQGQGRIGPVTLSYTDKSSGREHSLSTRSITVEVIGPTAGSSGGTGGLKWLIIGVMVLAAGGGILFAALKRRRPAEEEEAAPEARRPEDLALERLESVPELRLAGETKEYYSTIAAILREYIDSSFSLHTAELTTPDILNHLLLQGIEDGTRTDIEKILTTCDMVKFARHEPQPADLDAIFAMARDFFSGRREDRDGPGDDATGKNERS